METLKEGDYAIMVSVPTYNVADSKLNDIVKIVRAFTTIPSKAKIVDVFNFRLEKQINGFYMRRFKKIDVDLELIDLINL